MSDDGGDDEQKTEDPSERRLQQSFDQGDIPLSKEVATIGATIAGLGTLFALGSSLQGRLLKLMQDVVTLAPSTPFSSLPTLVFPIVVPLLGALVAMAAVAIALTFAQTRAHFWEDKATPDLSRVFSPERLGHFVSKAFWVDLAVSIVKVVAVAWVCWNTLRGEFMTLPKLMHAAPGDQLAGLFGPLSKAVLRVVGLLVVFAGADFALTRWRYRKRLMMTKDELKREMREDDGDPMMKGARKRRHRELVKRNAIAETKRADALIVNPTHIAIAVRYRKDEGGAPRVVAKGKGALAEVMRDTARENGIPIVQDIPLARLLYKKVKVGGSVPADTFKAVATILAFVYKLTGRSQGSGAAGARP